jgi:glycosyltransferase involved in cell wall biosynthesis
MPSNDTLISVCLPTRNGAGRVESVVRSIQAQDHANLELIISDNASSDGTEDVCRELAKADERIVYVRHQENVGLLNNFVSAMHKASGAYFRWVGDDDWLSPHCLSRCLEEFHADERRILVTMGVEFVAEDGATETGDSPLGPLGSDDPIERVAEMLRLLNASYLSLDPLYGLMRRKAIAPIPRRNMLREDQIFAVKMALTGSWGHAPEVLGRRGWRDETTTDLARRLGVPGWTARAATTLQLAETLRWISGAPGLTPEQRRKAKALVYRWYAGHQRSTIVGRSRGLARKAGLISRKRASAGAH